MTMRKAFYPTTVQADGRSTLTITLQNISATALVNVLLTDNLPTAQPPMELFLTASWQIPVAAR